MTILDVLREHEIKYDGYDQNTDCWYCTCNGVRQYRSRREAEDKHLTLFLEEPAPIWERMRAAADTMIEARTLLPKRGYSPEYRWDIETLRSFADQWEADAAKVKLTGELSELVGDWSLAEAILREYDVVRKEAA